MSARVIAQGSDFMCFIRSGSEGSYTYKPIAGQTNCTLQREANYRESNAKNQGGYKNFFQGLKGWSATVEMNIPDQSDTNADEVSFEELQDYEEAGTKPTFVFAWVSIVDDEPEVDLTKRMYVGPGLVNCPLNANSGENATTSVAIQGCMKLNPIDPA